MSSIELSDLKISKDSSERQSKTRKAKMKALENLGKPPLAILEEDLGQLTEEDFELLNPHELNIKQAIDKKVDIRQKIKDLDLLRQRLSQLLEADSRLKKDYGPNSDGGRLKKQIKKEEDEIEALLTDAILAEFGEGKRKRKKTHKKSKKKHTKKHTKKHRKKHQKKHRKKHTKKK
tara:strand:- start:231 stop:758 length:528 start_codon:yes stop_codon:yes gene_type:complete